jgi:hypothetical protein
MEGSQMNEQLKSPPRLEPTPEWITARRTHLVREIAAAPPTAVDATRRLPLRPRWRVVAIAFAVILLGSGAALAATGFDLLDWIRSDNPSEAAFSIDTSRVYSGLAPESISCADPSDADTFGCKPGRQGQWVYTLYERVEARPEFTREAALAGLADAERAGSVSHELAEDIRMQIAAVDDEFFRKLDVLRTVQMISSAHEVRPGVLLVPPAGIPQFATCEAGEGSDLRCRNLPATVVPVGAPIYGLVENDGWVERPFERQGPRDVAPLYEALFGRPLTAAEERLLITISTAAAPSEPRSTGAVEVSPEAPGG